MLAPIGHVCSKWLAQRHLILPQESRSQESHALITIVLLLNFEPFGTRTEGPTVKRMRLAD